MSKPLEFKAERPEQWPADTYGIRIYRDGVPGPWIHWCECVTSHGIMGEDGVTPVGWAGSKTQADSGASMLQRLYDNGEIA